MSDLISFAGLIVSVVGLWIAIAQIRKALHVAESAVRAAQETQRQIVRNVLLVEITACTRAIEELKVFVQSQRHDAALLRIGDVIAQVIQLQQLHQQSPDDSRILFSSILTDLNIIRNQLERKIQKTSAEVDGAQINSQLSTISDRLNRWIGQQKYVVREGR